MTCSYEAITLYGAAFQQTLDSLSSVRLEALTPHLIAVARNDSVCPVPLSVALTYGISNLISFPTGNRMFRFPEFSLLNGVPLIA